MMELRAAKIELMEKLNSQAANTPSVSPEAIKRYEAVLAAKEDTIRGLERQLNDLRSEVGERIQVITRLESKLAKEIGERQTLSERLFETEMALDMAKDNQEAAMKRVEDEIANNERLKQNFETLKKSKAPSMQNSYAAEDDQDAESQDMVGRLQTVISENQELKKKYDEQSKQILDLLVNTGAGGGDSARLKAENEALKQSLEEMNKQILQFTLMPSLQSKSFVEEPPKMMHSVSQMNHEVEILKLENEGLKQELNRLNGVVQKLSERPASDPKSSPLGIRMLQEQISTLENELAKSRDQRNNSALDAERLRQAEMRLTDIRVENEALKTRCSYMDEQLRMLNSELVKKDSNHEELVNRLREEIKGFRESEMKGSFAGSSFGISPQIGPSSMMQGKSRMISPVFPDDNFRKEKAVLEANIANLENELRTKDKHISNLTDRINTLNKDIDVLKPNANVSSGEGFMKKENILLRERMALMEEREKELLESEAHKDQHIKQLQEQVRRLEENDDQSLNLDNSGLGLQKMLDSMEQRPRKDHNFFNAKLSNIPCETGFSSSEFNYQMSNAPFTSNKGPSSGYNSVSNNENVEVLKQELKDKEEIINSLSIQLNEVSFL